MLNNNPTSGRGVESKNLFFYCNLTATRMETMEKMERMDNKYPPTYGIR
jgi:hypothetical protein